MGVQGLWQLLQSTGRPVSLDSLEGKILAIDVSLWLHRTVKGMRDKDGNPLPNAHLQGLFHRICKLLYYRIKPIFVFDGGVPQLKRQTLANRRQKKEFAERESGKASKKLLSNLINSQAVREALGQGGTPNLDVLQAKSSVTKQPDLFELPPLTEPVPGCSTDGADSQLDSWEEQLEMIEEEYENLEDIDINSADFQSLPLEIQHELLEAIKAKRKRTCWAHVSELPKESTDFSNYQMSKLVKQSKLSTELDKVRKNMNNQNSGDIYTDYFGEDFFSEHVQTRRVVSEDASHFILIKGLSQKKRQEHIQRLEDKERLIDSPQTSDVTDTTSDELMLESEAEQALFKRKEKEMQQAAILVPGPKESQLSSLETVECCVTDKMNDERGHSKRRVEDASQLPTIDLEQTVVGAESKLNEAHLKDLEKAEKNPDTNLASTEVISSLPNSPDKNNSQLLVTGKDFFLKKRSLSVEHDLKYIKKQKSEEHVSEKNTAIIQIDADNVTVELDPELEETADEEIETRKTAEENSQNPGAMNVQDTSSDSDDDFIEVTVDPNKLPENPDLFPANIFDNQQAILDDILMMKFNRNSPKEGSSSVTVGNPLMKYSPNKTIESESKEEVEEEGDEQAESETETEKLINVEEDSMKGVIEISPDRKMDMIVVDGGVKEAFSEEAPSRNIVSDFISLTEVDLQDMQEELAVENRALQRERGKQERLATSITDQMYTEAQDLLHLFGIPYVVSAMEAESQCAELDMTGQSDGTVTDDSDIWLFGGKRVYKNLFNQDRTVEFFTDTTIKEQLGLDREKLVNIALLCGSDYTEGIQGIGPVGAMEILAEFSGSGVEGLRALKSWWEDAQKQPKSRHDTRLKIKLREVELTKGFPSHAVVEAYLNPAVEKSSEAFTWGHLDLDLLREFAVDKFGWSTIRADETLLPVIKQLNKKQIQPGIQKFFQPEAFMVPTQLKSKRLTNAVSRVINPVNTGLTVEEAKEKRKQHAIEIWNKNKANKKGKSKGKGKGKRKPVTEQDVDTSRNMVQKDIDLSESSSSEEELEGGFVREEKSDKKSASPQKRRKFNQQNSGKKFVSMLRSVDTYSNK